MKLKILRPRDYPCGLSIVSFTLINKESEKSGSVR